MKLCKACNGKIPDVNYNWTYCEREVCVKARKAVARKRYKAHVDNPYSHYDERMNWICKCPEQWVVPAQFNYCSKCGAMPRQRYAQKSRVFVPKKHGVSIDSFIQSYFDRQKTI